MVNDSPGGNIYKQFRFLSNYFGSY